MHFELYNTNESIEKIKWKNILRFKSNVVEYEVGGDCFWLSTFYKLKTISEYVYIVLFYIGLIEVSNTF